jgi:hypothetical protein
MNLTNLETVFVVFGRWRVNDTEHVIGIFRTEEDAERAKKEAVTQTIPRFEASVREFGVQ